MSVRLVGTIVSFAAAAVLIVPITSVATGASSLPIFTAITAGYHHTCALTSAGGVKCWGDNGAGQLGNGSTADSGTPVDVVGLASGVTAITAGGSHTCALTSGGAIKCWGANGSGQLGNGSNTNSNIPVGVVGLASGVTRVAADGFHTCAVTASGGVKCWGGNAGGQLGNGSTMIESFTPVDVVGLTSGVTAVATGEDETCALTSGGGVKCWGFNHFGQLGNGSADTGRHATPVDVVGLASGVKAIAAGYFYNCALTTAGDVKCWGHDGTGQLANGTADNVDHGTPVDATGLPSAITDLVAGVGHDCVLTSVGGARCLGYNASGQLGNGSTADSLTLVDVAGLSSGVTAIAAGYHHTCAIATGGGVKCWGYNQDGQLGNGSTTNSSTPVDIRLAPTAPAGLTRAWQARIGTSGVNGTARIVAVTGGVGSIGLAFAKLKSSSTLPVTLSKGSCTSVGTVLLKLAAIKTSRTGTASRTTLLTAAQVKLITAATTGTGKFAVRVGTGTSTKCGVFASLSVKGPQAVVQAFYNWYISRAASGTVSLRGRADLTPAFITFVEHYNDGQMFGGADPVLCAQAIPDSVKAGPATIAGSSATVPITEAFAGNPPPQLVKLTLSPTGWQISAVRCVA